ncbi:MAG: hypothetical protein IPK10_00755 [Bacteroidetes bacterium]|nr:hypothetical protein [Bacteroidota bacterium]
MLLLEVFFANACDVCGSFIGIHPGDRKSYVGVFYRYSSFSSSNPRGSSFFPDGGLRLTHDGHSTSALNSDQDYEVYRGVEWRAKYYVHSRVEVSLIVPFNFNTAFENSRQVNVDGIGDITTMVGWQAIDDLNIRKTKHRLLMGLGVKWATGKSNEKRENTRLNIMIQPGSGSNDLLFFTNYQLGLGKWSWNVLPTFKLNGTNRFGEQIANSTTLFSSIAYQADINDNLKLIPAAQSYYEYMSGITVDKEKLNGTAMSGLYVGPGADVMYKNVGLNSSFWWNVYEDQSQSSMASRIRYRIGFTWYFNQQSFMF